MLPTRGTYVLKELDLLSAVAVVTDRAPNTLIKKKIYLMLQKVQIKFFHQSYLLVAKT